MLRGVKLPQLVKRGRSARHTQCERPPPPSARCPTDLNLWASVACSGITRQIENLQHCGSAHFCIKL